MSQATFAGVATSYSTSLYTSELALYATSSTILQLLIPFQYQAGVQQGQASPTIGQISGSSSSSQTIFLATSDVTAKDITTMSVNPLGLSPPVPGTGLPAGGFRIITPAFDSASQTYNGGTV